MNCDDIRLLLEVNSDGELDPVRQLELETHLRTCPDCALNAKAVDVRRRALSELLPRFTVPPQLREKVRALVRTEETGVQQRAPRRELIQWSYWNLGGMAALLALGLTVGYSVGHSRARASSLFDEAISGHVRSLQAGHLMDVISTDQHTVKPWFIGKVDFSPPVADLADLGFPLAGGRLERIAGRPAAALVFHRRLHLINVFIWPANDGEVQKRDARENGYNARSWSQGGLNFLAVSEIPSTELDQFVGEFRKRTD